MILMQFRSGLLHSSVADECPVTCFEIDLGVSQAITCAFAAVESSKFRDSSGAPNQQLIDLMLAYAYTASLYSKLYSPGDVQERMIDVARSPSSMEHALLSLKDYYEGDCSA